MAQMTPREIQNALAMPFAPEDLEWRLQRTIEEKMCGLAVPFVTNRAIQNRLDEVVGPENWYNDFKPWHSVKGKESQLCGIAIYFEERKEWICKWDGAEDSDIEPVKGGLSDSMKRAAVHWGIGRVLYNMDSVWVDIEKKGKSFDIKDSARAKLDRVYLDMLKKLGQTPAPPMGTAAQLTPKAAKEDKDRGATSPNAGHTVSSQEKTPQSASAPVSTVVAKPMDTEPAQVTVLPQAQPEYEYVVVSTQLQKGMSSQTTTVVLRDLNGKETKAFARGVHDALASGTQLTDVKLSLKQQRNVAYYVLENYRIAAPEYKAA